jgi:two-component system response regulator FlrC
MASANADDQPVAVEPSSLQLLQLAKRVAETDSTVLICGESGTGKEVLARYVHQQSKRSQQPFVAINCAAIPENMLEGMLFGHEKGAFTGAYNSAPGKFEQANGGTLLLDEISEMDIGLQAKILRVIQEREVERLGGRKTIDLDVRIIATTNRQLEEEVKAGRFREDLYYRLSVFPLQWLPLRERSKDIVPLAQKLLKMHTTKMGRTPVDLDHTAVHALASHNWPGNVRELDNVMQRALIMQPGTVISDFHLRLDPFNNQPINIGLAPSLNVTESSDSHSVNHNVLEDDLQRREFEIIVDTLKSEGGSRKNTAEKLGISPRTLRYKLAKMRDIGISLEGELQSA